MNAEQLWDTTMNPEFRTLRQVTIDNGTEADRIFSMLMGDEVPPRREFIEKNAVYANIDAQRNINNSQKPVSEKLEMGFLVFNPLLSLF